MFAASSSQVSSSKLFVDDVFSAYTYTGNGSTQTITNGIDLAGKGGLVWIKNRGAALDNYLTDSARGPTASLTSNTTAAQVAIGAADMSYQSTGFSLLLAGANSNGTSNTYASWTFRKAPKFFDVVTYTGDGLDSRLISHSLGIAPGMIIVKCTSTTGAWGVYHKDLGVYASDITKNVYLNTTAAADNSGLFRTGGINSSTFSVRTDAIVNASGQTYVAYLFAHDTSTDGIIQCGSFTTDGSGKFSVNCGFETQFVMIKRTDSTSNWFMLDTSRGMSYANTEYLSAQSSGAAANDTVYVIKPTATGFDSTVASVLPASSSWIYLAIRRPNKPPTTGTQVYNAIARTGTGAAATVTGVGFAPDLALAKARPGANAPVFFDRLRGKNNALFSSSTNAEDAAHADQLLSFDMDGVSLGSDAWFSSINAGQPYINHFFRRAPGCFDQVCYTGTAMTTQSQVLSHNLGASPEMMIARSRVNGGNWTVGHVVDLTKVLFIETAVVWQPYQSFDTPTASTLTIINNATNINLLGDKYVMYLFATKPGISKVGSYTGNGSSQTINCGFSTGARFFLVKATSSTGSWWIFDSVRGIISAADPTLQLNSTAAEITSADACDPDTSGIIVNQEATCSINASGVSYIFLALS